MEKVTQSSQSPSNNIYIAPLPSQTKEADLAEYFESNGIPIININVITNNSNGFCKGYAFVKLHPTVNTKCFNEENIHWILGRKVFFSFFRSQQELEAKKEITNRKRVFVSNIPQEMKDSELGKVFSQFGEVLSAYRIRKHGTGRPMPYGYLFYEKEKSASMCINAGKVLVSQTHGFIYVEPYVRNRRAKELFKIKRKQTAIQDQVDLRQKKCFFKNEEYSHHKGYFTKNMNPGIINSGNKINNGFLENFHHEKINKSSENERRYSWVLENERHRLKQLRRREARFHRLKPSSAGYWDSSENRNGLLKNSCRLQNLRLNRCGCN